MQNSEPLKKYTSDNTLRYRDVLSVQTDLQTVAAQLKKLRSLDQSDETQVLRLALWNSSLATFFKCFATGVRQYKIDPDIFATLPGEPLRFVEFLKNQRDKHVAHSVNMFEEISVGVMLDHEKKQKVGIGHLQIRRVGEPDDHIRSFQRLVEAAISRAATDFTTITDEINGELDSITYDEMLGWDDLQYVVPEPERAASKARKQAT